MSDDATKPDEPEQVADPFTIFIEAHHEARRSNPGTKRFNAGEHAWLGDHGAALACERVKNEPGLGVSPTLFQSLKRKDGKDDLPYGELVALSGDFYGSPEDLFAEKPSLLPWRKLAAIRELFDEEMGWIEERAKQNAEQKDAPPYPEHNLRMAWRAKHYLELALDNTDHFGWHNVLAYCLHHEKAMRLAAAADPKAGPDDETLRRALYTNAFADHFLTDGFAAGHIRVPRAEIRYWAVEQGLNEMNAGSLSKLLHDQDGHVDLQSLHGVTNENTRRNDDGLEVENAAKKIWYTRCDGQLFTGQEPFTSPRITQAVEAVAASVTELLRAWKLRKLPTDIYAATNFVPFPRSTTPRLIEKFPSDLSKPQLDALWKRVEWYSTLSGLGGLELKHLQEFLAALPVIMERFRSNITRDIRQDQRRLRIAPAYLSAFQKIA